MALLPKQVRDLATLRPSAPERSRTHNPRIRSAVLYPVELQAPITPDGLEPSYADPESAVLPLDEGAVALTGVEPVPAP